MQGTHHVFDLLKKPPVAVEGGVCAMFGADRFLKLLAVRALVKSVADDDEFGATQFSGDTTTWVDVVDELSTRSLFGGDSPRVVVIDNADPFVKNHRDKIEDLLRPGPSGSLLVLVADSWAANTRLYKKLDKTALQVQCEAPVIKRGRGKTRDDKKTISWLVARATKEYGFALPAEGAGLMIELTDCEFGRMDQELAKLALYADGGQLTLETVRKVVGGWRTETMWSAIDAAVDGESGRALELLDQLLRSSEHPLALFGQLSWSLRRYAEAAEIVARQQRDGVRVDLNGAMKEAGFNAWGGGLENAARGIRQLGRDRAFKLYDWLLEADLALKGTHSKDDRARLVLEKLFVRMSKELATAAAGA